MDNKDLLREMRASEFAQHNNRVLCIINILRPKYVKLESVQDVLQKEMDEGDFLDCINFLQKAKYLELRTIRGHMEATIADTDYQLLEGTVSLNGFRLLGGEITDKLVKA